MFRQPWGSPMASPMASAVVFLTLPLSWLAVVVATSQENANLEISLSLVSLRVRVELLDDATLLHAHIM